MGSVRVGIGRVETIRVGIIQVGIIQTPKFITYLLHFIIVAFFGELMRKTKRNVETNDIINEFKELTVNACFPKCSVLARDIGILMVLTADYVLLKNHEKQKYVEVKEGNTVV